MGPTIPQGVWVQIPPWVCASLLPPACYVQLILAIDIHPFMPNNRHKLHRLRGKIDATLSPIVKGFDISCGMFMKALRSIACDVDDKGHGLLIAHAIKI